MRTAGAFLDLDDPKATTPLLAASFGHAPISCRLRFSVLVPRSSVGLLRGILNGLPLNFGTVLRTRMERCFPLHPNRTNPYAHALLLGDMRSALDSPRSDRSTLHARTRPIS